MTAKLFTRTTEQDTGKSYNNITTLLVANVIYIIFIHHHHGNDTGRTYEFSIWCCIFYFLSVYIYFSHL